VKELKNLHPSKNIDITILKIKFIFLKKRGIRLEEAKFINSSLCSLGNVISSLASKNN